MNENKIEAAFAVLAATQRNSAQKAARSYLEKLSEALDILAEYNSKAVGSMDQLNEMKQAFWKGGNPVCLSRTPNGLCALIGEDGSVLATYTNYGAGTEIK